MIFVGKLSLLWQVPCRAQRHTARHDGHFYQRIAPTQQPRDCRVTCFVVSHRTFLLFGHNLILSLQATDDTIHGVHEVLSRNRLMVITRCYQCSLVADIGNIRTRETRCLLSQEIDIQVLVYLDACYMYAKYLLALLQVGQFYMYLTVETSCTQQRSIQHIGAVGSRQDDHTRIATKTIHLSKQLIQRRFALIVATTHHIIFATSTTHGINLINKHDSRSFLLSLTEEVAHTARTYTHEHLHEVATRHREEWHIRLACHSLSEQGLTRSRRTYEQHALWNLTTQVGVFSRVLEEGHNLLHLLFSTCQTCHIFEGDFVLLVFVKHLGFGFTHIEYTTWTAACSIRHSAAHPHKEQDYQRKRQDIHQYHIPIVF